MSQAGVSVFQRLHTQEIAGTSRSECRLSSEKVEHLEVRLVNNLDKWEGGIYYRDKLLAPFALGAFQGYGSVIWSVPTKYQSRDSGEAIRFSGATPTRGTEGKLTADKYLFAGLGRFLYYGSASIPGLELRYTPQGLNIIRAGEGFWMIGRHCIDRFVF